MTRKKVLLAKHPEKKTNKMATSNIEKIRKACEQMMEERDFGAIQKESAAWKIRVEHACAATSIDCPDKAYREHIKDIKLQVRDATNLNTPLGYLEYISQRDDKQMEKDRTYNKDIGLLLQDTFTLLCIMRQSLFNPSLAKDDKAAYIACIDELIGPVKKLQIKFSD